MDDFKLGVEMGAYNAGARKLESWHSRPGARKNVRVPKDPATTTVRVMSAFEKVEFRGSGFYAGGCR